jgi:hypothetical protein
MRLFQLIRAGLYEVVRMRPLLENPFIETGRGLYSVALCRKRNVP